MWDDKNNTNYSYYKQNKTNKNFECKGTEAKKHVWKYRVPFKERVGKSREVRSQVCPMSRKGRNCDDRRPFRRNCEVGSNWRSPIRSMWREEILWVGSVVQSIPILTQPEERVVVLWKSVYHLKFIYKHLLSLPPSLFYLLPPSFPEFLCLSLFLSLLPIWMIG